MKRVFYAMVVAVVALVMPSCASDASEVLDTIPADAQMVAMIDAASAMKHFGVEVDADGLTFAPEIQNVKSLIDKAIPAEEQKNVAQKMSAFMAIIDVENIAGYFSADETVYFTTIVKNEGLLEKTLTENGITKSQIAGFDCYKLDGRLYMLVKDAQAWIVERESDAERLKTELDKASSNPITSNAAVCEYLAQDNDMNAVASTKQLNVEELGKDGWIRASANMKGTGIEATLSAVKSDGSVVDFSEYLGEINDDVLQYIPQKSMLAVALGIDSNMKWDLLDKVLATMSYGDRATAELFRPYIESIDGSVLLTVSPAVEGVTPQMMQSPDAWEMKFMAHMPQDKIDGAIEKIVSTIEADYRITLPREGNFYSIPNPEMPMKVGSHNGYFVIAKGGIDVTASNENMKRAMSGARVAAALKGENIMPALKAMDWTLRVEDKEVKVSLSFKLSGNLVDYML